MARTGRTGKIVKGRSGQAGQTGQTGKIQAALRPKTLILIRHAHRDTSRRELDNGLDEKGRAQAADLLKHYQRKFPATRRDPKPEIVTSAKLRCVETILPIARLAEAKVKAMPVLLEKQEHETAAAFRARVESFGAWWLREAGDLTIACSHGDWLPLCVQHLTGARVELRKGAWAEIVLREGKPTLRWLIQGFTARHA